MLASMVLSENGARVLENAVADAERRVEKKKRAARDANAARPSVFVEPCDVCLALREVASKNVPNGKKDAAARTKLCSRCQVKARDLAIEAVRARGGQGGGGGPRRRGAGGGFSRRTQRRWPRKSAREAHKRAMRDPTNARRGTTTSRRTCARRRRRWRWRKRPARVAALHRASALRVAMETATHERERELRRERVVAAMGARRKEGPMEEDEKWLV